MGPHIELRRPIKLITDPSFNPFHTGVFNSPLPLKLEPSEFFEKFTFLAKIQQNGKFAIQKSDFSSKKGPLKLNRDT